MPDDMKPLTVRFPTHVLDEINDRAKSSRQSVSDVVRRFVEEAFVGD